MTNPVWLDPDLLVERALWIHVLDTCRPQAREALRRMVSRCRATHASYASPTLRQSLLIAFARPQGQRGAFVYLTLTTGAVFALRVDGIIEVVVDQLLPISRILAQASFELECFADLEARISEQLPAQARLSCKFRLLRHAPVVPDSRMIDHILEDNCLPAYAELQASYCYPSPQPMPSELLRYFEQVFSEKSEAILAFKDGLREEVRAATAAFSAPFSSQPDQLNVYNFFSGGDETTSRNRRQAVEQLPWMLPLLTHVEPAPWRLGADYDSRRRLVREKLAAPARRIQDAIDRGRPLFHAVSEALRVPVETVRWSRGQVLPNVGYFDHLDADLLVVALSWLAPEKRPTSPARWLQFGGVVSDCIAILCAFNYRYTEDSVEWGPPARSLAIVRYRPLAAVLGQWVRALMRDLEVRDTMPAWHASTIHRRLERVPNFLTVLCRGIDRYLFDKPQLRGEIYADAAYLQAWLARTGIHALLRSSDAWHRIVAGVDSEPALSPQEHATWPPLFDRPQLIHDRVCHELASTAELADEGESMNHCVARYAAECKRLSTLMFSLRDSGNRRWSTVQVRINECVPRAHVIAHFGPHNVAPDPNCADAVAVLVAQLNSPPFAATLHARACAVRQLSNKEDLMGLDELRGGDEEGFDRRITALAWKYAFGSEPGDGLPVDHQDILEELYAAYHR